MVKRLVSRFMTTVLVCLLALPLIGCDATHEAKQGDIVQLGSYYVDSSEEKSPIEWIVLENSDGLGLLLSKDILFYYPYDLSDHNANLDEEGPSWDKSLVREYLNGDFLDEAFTSEEVQEMGSIESEENNSKVFLLSVDMFNAFLPDDYRVAKSTPYAEELLEILDQNESFLATLAENTKDCWLLSDTFKADEWESSGLVIVTPDGEISNAMTLESLDASLPYFPTAYYGVRPAIAINLDGVRPVES